MFYTLGKVAKFLLKAGAFVLVALLVLALLIGWPGRVFGVKPLSEFLMQYSSQELARQNAAAAANAAAQPTASATPTTAGKTPIWQLTPAAPAAPAAAAATATPNAAATGSPDTVTETNLITATGIMTPGSGRTGSSTMAWCLQSRLSPRTSLSKEP